jgi:hypothetical protein
MTDWSHTSCLLDNFKKVLFDGSQRKYVDSGVAAHGVLVAVSMLLAMIVISHIQ